MGRQFVFLFFSLISVVLYANNDVNSKYLKGAVTELDGKVVFSKSISVNNSISDDKLFELMDTWAKENYSGKDGDKNRVVLSDAKKRNIACLGEKDLVFKSTALSLDRSIMNYQLVIEVEDHTSKISVRNIKLWYNDANKEVQYPAEELISDKVALNKQGTKLNRYYDKFRIHAVDSIDALFNSIDKYLDKHIAKKKDVVVQSTTVVAHPSSNVEDIISTMESLPSEKASTLSGYKSISPDRMPGNIIRLLNDWAVVTSGTTDVNVLATSWGGLGILWDKPVAFSFIGDDSAIKIMDEGDIYAISFFTETYRDDLRLLKNKTENKIASSGLTPVKTPLEANAFSEAWMIIECRKILAQPVSVDSITDSRVKKEALGKEFSKMYIGEILNVWVK